MLIKYFYVVYVVYCKGINFHLTTVWMKQIDLTWIIWISKPAILNSLSPSSTSTNPQHSLANKTKSLDIIIPSQRQKYARVKIEWLKMDFHPKTTKKVQNIRWKYIKNRSKSMNLMVKIYGGASMIHVSELTEMPLSTA